MNGDHTFPCSRNLDRCGDVGFPTRGEPYITASIQITGAWKGVVSVHVPFELGEEIAAIMFEDEIDFINTEDLEDAMGEITNIISGSFKSMLEGICHLGLPIVTRGLQWVNRGGRYLRA